MTLLDVAAAAGRSPARRSTCGTARPTGQYSMYDPQVASRTSCAACRRAARTARSPSRASSPAPTPAAGRTSTSRSTRASTPPRRPARSSRRRRSRCPQDACDAAYATRPLRPERAEPRADLARRRHGLQRRLREPARDRVRHARQRHHAQAQRRRLGILAPGGLLHDRGVDQPLDRRVVVGVDVAALQRGLEPRRGLQRERAQVAGEVGGAQRRRPRTAASDAIRIVFVSLTGSRATCLNTEPIVAVSTFSSRSEPSGWPTLMNTAPPGRSRSRASAKNSLRRQVERDVGLAVGVEEDRVEPLVGAAQERARILGVQAQLRPRLAGRSTRARCRAARRRSPPRRSPCPGSSAPYARAVVPAPLPRIARCARRPRQHGQRIDEERIPVAAGQHGARPVQRVDRLPLVELELAHRRPASSTTRAYWYSVSASWITRAPSSAPLTVPTGTAISAAIASGTSAPPPPQPERRDRRRDQRERQERALRADQRDQQQRGEERAEQRADRRDRVHPPGHLARVLDRAASSAGSPTATPSRASAPAPRPARARRTASPRTRRPSTRRTPRRDSDRNGSATNGTSAISTDAASTVAHSARRVGWRSAIRPPNQ